MIRTLIVITGFVIIGSLWAADQPARIGLSIVGNDKLEIVATPILSPAIVFRVEGIRPSKGNLLLCTQVNDHEDVAGHTVPVVRLNCDEGKTVLTVTGISFQ